MSEYIVEWDGATDIHGWKYTAVREPIVRCRDCRYAPEKARHMWCQRPLWCDGEADHYCEPDDFCAWGERRSDG